MRSEATSRRFGEVGASERMSRAVPYASGKRDVMRAAGVVRSGRLID
jgi:hypothetical protein